MASYNTGFPTLKPALFIRVNVGENTPTGFIKSVDGFKPEINATIMFGDDWLAFDPDRKSARMNLTGIAQNFDGVPFAFTIDGTAIINEEMAKISAHASGRKAIPFGKSTTNHTFRSGHHSFKGMDKHQWIGNGRFVVAENKVAVESYVSTVMPMC